MANYSYFVKIYDKSHYNIDSRLVRPTYNDKDS